MSIKKTLEILVLELMYPIMGKMGLNAYFLVKGPTKILKTLQNNFLLLLLVFYQLAGFDECSLKILL